MYITAFNNTTAAGSADLSSARALTAEQRSLIRAVATVNASGTLPPDNELTYSVDRAARLVVVRLVSKSTGSVVQQIPSEYLLRMAEETNEG